MQVESSSTVKEETVVSQEYIIPQRMALQEVSATEKKALETQVESSSAAVAEEESSRNHRKKQLQHLEVLTRSNSRVLKNAEQRQSKLAAVYSSFMEVSKLSIAAMLGFFKAMVRILVNIFNKSNRPSFT